MEMISLDVSAGSYALSTLPDPTPRSRLLGRKRRCFPAFGFSVDRPMTHLQDKLQIARSQIANHQSPITNHQSPITNHRFSVHFSLLTSHPSPRRSAAL